MADAAPSTTLASAFPAPPPFYKHFTPSNLARLQEAQDGAQLGNPNATATPQQQQASPTQLSALPLELLHLIPPSPPPHQTPHQTFSTPHSLTPHITSLSSRALEQLIPPSSSTTSDTNPTTHLLTLSKSLLLSFLSLISLLSLDPALAHQKVEDLRVLFANLHDQINRQRAHGARETLITMMEGEIVRRRGEVERVGALTGRVAEVLGRFGKTGVQESQENGVEQGNEKMGKERRIFDAMDEIDIG